MNVSGLTPEKVDREALCAVFTDLGVSEDRAQACIDDNPNLWGALLAEGSALSRYAESGDSSLLSACFDVKTSEEVDALLAEKPLMDCLMDEGGSEVLGRLMFQEIVRRGKAEVDRGEAAGAHVSSAATARPVAVSIPQRVDKGGEVKQPVNMSRRAVLAGLTFLGAVVAGGVGLNTLLNSGRPGESSEAAAEDPKKAAYTDLIVKDSSGSRFERVTRDGRKPKSLSKSTILGERYLSLTLNDSEDIYLANPRALKGLSKGDSLPFRRMLRVHFNAEDKTFDPVEFAGKKVKVRARVSNEILTILIGKFKFVCPVSFEKLNTKKSGNVPVIFDGDID